MEVITIESQAFQEILNQIEAIKTEVKNRVRPAEDTNKWLDNDEAASFLKVTKRTLQTYRDQGEISFSQKGSKIYYRMSDIEEFLQKYHHKAFKYTR
jgi:hypothetical protein